MSWNGFSTKIVQLINVFTARAQVNNTAHAHLEAGHADSFPPEKLPTIWMPLLSIAKHSNILTRKFTNKTRRLLKGRRKFAMNWRTTNYNCFVSCNKTPGIGCIKGNSMSNHPDGEAKVSGICLTFTSQ